MLCVRYRRDPGSLRHLESEQEGSERSVNKHSRIRYRQQPDDSTEDWIVPLSQES